MTSLLSTILSISLAALVFATISLELKHWHARRLVTTGTLIAFALGIFALTSQDTIETKGSMDETIAVIFCYLAMLLGMAAEYCYAQAESGRKRFKFEPMQFFMPIFASPIVFIPLLTITADMSMGGAFTKPKLMVYLVAFQNGFFWKNFFEQRRREARENALEFTTTANPPRSRTAAAK